MSEKPMDKMREEFEKWATLEGFDITKHISGIYKATTTAIAWEGYQAASKEGQRYKEGLKKIASTTEMLYRLKSNEIARQILES